MPIYEYRCGACSHYLDALQKISDPPLSDCPECHEPALKRLISAPSFRLKGGGWYETDFKSDKDRRRNLAEAGERDSGDKKKDAGDKVGGTDGTKKDGAGKEKKAADSTSESKKPAAKSTGSGSEAA